MITFIYEILPALCLSLVSALLLFPLMIKLSPVLGLVDVPNERKVHFQPIPAIGGLVITMSVIPVILLNPAAMRFVQEHIVIIGAMLVLLLTGILDDRFNLSPKLRLSVQLLCACSVTLSGIRIHSLHGIMGIYEIGDAASIILTTIIITGVTNSFNLIDGINGLAGTIALSNICVLIAMSIFTNYTECLYLLLPLAIGLSVFLKYNWKKASIFMGDSGSLLLGFFSAVIGIYYINRTAGSLPGTSGKFTVIVTAYCLLPVADALRVFYCRYKKGKSIFQADKTHIHHILLKLNSEHSKATKKIISFHVLLIVGSMIAVQFLSVGTILPLQGGVTILYISGIRMLAYFQRWKRHLKKLEMEH